MPLGMSLGDHQCIHDKVRRRSTSSYSCVKNCGYNMHCMHCISIGGLQVYHAGVHRLCTLLIDFQIALDHLPEIQTSESGDHVKRFAAGFSPVRITPYFVEPLSSTFRPQLTSPSGALMKMLSLLTNTLLVRQISGNMKIPPSCSEYTYGPNIGKCRVIHSTTYCGSYTVPRQFIGTREVCSTSYGPCRESGINGTGAANTDFLLFVGTQCKFISRVRIPSLTSILFLPIYSLLLF